MNTAAHFNILQEFIIWSIKIIIFFHILVTLDSTVAVEWPSEDTVILHNVIKRVWPASQRDALFWSHKRHIPGESEETPDRWIVVNYSTNHPRVPVSFTNWRKY